MSLLDVSALAKSFGGVKAVDGVSFQLAAGELLALIGPNGAGKSTTFNMVGGQLSADAGSVRLDGSELVGRPPRDIWRLGVGRTFQIAETFASLSVVENVQMALISADRRVFSMARSAAAYRRDDAIALLDRVGMAAQADRPCSVLAYGDIKRVELAIALAHAPKLLLMDEPTAGMAPHERNELMALTRQLAVEQRIGVLFTEHSMDVVFAHADRIIVLARGKLIAEGAPAAIRAHPKVQEVYFGSGRTFEDAPEHPRARAAAGRPAGGAHAGKPGQGGPGDIAISAAAAPATCATPRTASAAPAAAGSPALLEARRLCAWYGGAQILFDVDLRVGRGEVVALMGRNGAGKSTALKALMGLITRRSGAVSFLDADVSRLLPFRLARLGLGFVPDDRRIFTDLTVLENLEVGRQPVRDADVGFAAPVWTPQRLFELFPNLGEMARRPGGRMSGGEQKMLGVARTLMGNPHLLLLDEPSEGVAPLIVEQMAAMIVRLKEAGVSILLSEQNMHFAELVSDRAYVLEKGEVRYAGAMGDLAVDDAIRRAYLGV